MLRVTGPTTVKAGVPRPVHRPMSAVKANLPPGPTVSPHTNWAMHGAGDSATAAATATQTPRCLAIPSASTMGALCPSGLGYVNRSPDLAALAKKNARRFVGYHAADVI